jgi:hypothetical protein
MEERPNIADIQQAFLEYRANFKEPITSLWYGRRQGEIITALHKALSPWGVGLENIVWNQTPKNLGEVQLTFGVPSFVASIQVGIGGLTMNALNPDWSRAPQFISLFQTGVDAVTATVGQELRSQQTTLGFHVKPGTRPFREILGQVVNARMLGSEDAAMFGVSVYFSDFLFVIDKSVMFPEGVFIRLIRTFSAAARFEEMAAIIHKDEETVLLRLGLKLQ